MNLQGKYVEIVKDPTAPILNGLIGKVAFESTFEGKTVYWVRAENFGPYMPMPVGVRKVRAWLAGDLRAVLFTALHVRTVDNSVA